MVRKLRSACTIIVLGNEDVRVLLDSCLTFSFLSRKLVKHLNLSITQSIVHTMTGSVKGFAAQTNGCLKVVLKAQTNQWHTDIPVILHEFYVPGADILLGRNMLVGHRFILNFNKRVRTGYPAYGS